MSISSYASDSSAASIPHSCRIPSVNPVPSVGHGSARRPSSMRCLRPCTPPVRLFSVYSLHVQPSIRQPYCKD
eukprot:scaffold3827_cov137-Isochrysis_galbana.AAC.1